MSIYFWLNCSIALILFCIQSMTASVHQLILIEHSTVCRMVKVTGNVTLNALSFHVSAQLPTCRMLSVRLPCSVMNVRHTWHRRRFYGSLHKLIHKVISGIYILIYLLYMYNAGAEPDPNRIKNYVVSRKIDMWNIFITTQILTCVCLASVAIKYII